MAWATSTRAARLPADWPARRAAVRRRAQGRCEHINGTRCTDRGNECDHIIPGDNHALTNLQWLCGPHHRAKTQVEAAGAMRTLRARARHPRERHPGLT